MNTQIVAMGREETIPLIFAIERRDTSGGQLVAAFRFLSEDRSPWMALLRMRERWPELRFGMRGGYLQMGMSEEVGSGNAALITVSRWCWCCWWWSS